MDEQPVKQQKKHFLSSRRCQIAIKLPNFLRFNWWKQNKANKKKSVLNFFQHFTVTNTPEMIVNIWILLHYQSWTSGNEEILNLKSIGSIPDHIHNTTVLIRNLDFGNLQGVPPKCYISNCHNSFKNGTRNKSRKVCFLIMLKLFKHRNWYHSQTEQSCKLLF